IGGCTDVARQVAEVARKVHTFGDGLADLQTTGSGSYLLFIAAEDEFGRGKIIVRGLTFEFFEAISGKLKSLGQLSCLPGQVPVLDLNIGQACCQFPGRGRSEEHTSELQSREN